MESTSNEPTNERYVRQQLKPVMKSLYNNKRIRYNGSFQGGKGSTGAMNDTIRLISTAQQSEMIKTFNVNVLNNSFTGAMGFNRAANTTMSNFSNKDSVSPVRGIRSIPRESIAPFTFIPNAKIPDLSESRREEREERALNLLKRPKHKCVGSLETTFLSDKLMSAPLTM